LRWRLVVMMLLLPQAMRFRSLTGVPSRRQRTYITRERPEVKGVIAETRRIEGESEQALAEHSTREQRLQLATTATHTIRC
jgi:hypothetical protein